MKLVVLYGPPGVGKLTVSRALSKKTGFKVLHNHLSMELLCALFDWGTKPYRELSRRFRIELLETATRNRVRGVVLTLVYPAEATLPILKELVRRMHRRGVWVGFVKLECSRKELERRVRGASRRAFTKIKNSRELRSFFRKFGSGQTVPLKPHLTIDTISSNPNRVAKKIVNELSL